MITITIDEDTLLEMLLDRIEHWTNDINIIDLYVDYYEKLINSGCFEDCKLEINNIVDNDYINNMAIICKEDFGQWNIESEEDDRIKAFNKEKDLYLIRNY